MTETTEYIPATGDGKPDYDELDLSATSFWQQSAQDREHMFATLRELRPVSWQPPVEDAVTPDPDDPGYWAVVRHADIVTVSRDHHRFISGQGVLFDLLPPVFLEMSQSFLAMDPPRHDMLRRLVSAAFTPRQVARTEHKVMEAAHAIVSRVASRGASRGASHGEIEFVEECSGPLPLRVFSEMFGVPEELRATVGAAVADVVAWADPETLGDRSADEVQVMACVNLHNIAERMIVERRAKPTDDLMTSLVQAEIDGQRLNDREIGAFFVLMAVAGIDTTKHTASHTALAMTRFPEQREWLRADYGARINTATEEFVRYASPVMTFRRTAAVDTELAGRQIARGDKVVMFYPSGNWDRSVFVNPDTFDLARDPNPHVGFGGGGVHYCLGKQLAKSMLRALYQELLTQIPNFEASNPEYLGTNFMRGIKRMTLRFEAATR